MKLHPHYRPELVCSTEEERKNLSRPYFDRAAGRVVATEGHMLVAIPVEVEDGEESGPLSQAALALARGEDREDGESPLLRDGFPDWQRVMPDFQEGDPDTATVGLDVRYLAAIAEAIGSGGHVVLSFRLEGREAAPGPILVRCSEPADNPAVGALMPLNMSRVGRPVEQPWRKKASKRGPRPPPPHAAAAPSSATVPPGAEPLAKSDVSD